MRFSGHALFQRRALWIAGVTILISALALGLSSSPLVASAAAAAGSLVAGVWSAPAGRRQRILGTLLACLAAVALLLSPLATDTAFAMVVFGTCAGAATAALARGRARWFTLISGAGLMLLGWRAFHIVVQARELSALSPWLVGLFAGTAFAAVAVLTTLPAHLLPFGDAVDRSYRKVALLDGEIGALCKKCERLWRRAEPQLGDQDPNRGLLQEAVVRALGVASTWQQAGSENESPDTLSGPIEALDARISSSSDETTRAEFERARNALIKQQQYLREISVQRERVTAKLHSYVATMEQLELAMVNLKSARASNAPDLSSIVDELGCMEG